MFDAVTPSQYAVIVAVVVAFSMLLAYVAQRRSGPVERNAGIEQAATMQRFGRVIFAIIGFVALLGGLIADEPAVILFGVAFLIAALGQHWAYRNSPGR
jgi:cobalamin synthase